MNLATKFTLVVFGLAGSLAVDATAQVSPPVADDKSANATATATEIKTEDFELTDSKRDNRIVPIRVYHDGSKSKQPVVLFSHGLGGSRANNAYLGKHWAQHGYVCVFLQHAGSDIDVFKNAPRGERFQALKSAASYQSATARTADVSFVLDELEKFSEDNNHALHGRLDLEHVGLSGHSFGAATTLTMAGKKFGLRQQIVNEPRIDAFVAMSPQPGKSRNPERVFDALSRPLFSMTGTQDRSPIDPTVTPEKRQKVFEYLPKGDKFHLVLDGAEHHAFGDSNSRLRSLKRDPAHHAIIQRSTTEFWDAYLKDDGSARKWLRSQEPEKVKGFKESDVWAWK